MYDRLQEAININPVLNVLYEFAQVRICFINSREYGSNNFACRHTTI